MTNNTQFSPEVSPTKAINHSYAEIDSGFFEVDQSSRFWVGAVAVDGAAKQPGALNALLKFRGQVYVEELGWLKQEDLDDQGREIDLYDKRSSLFAVIENPEYYSPVNGNGHIQNGQNASLPRVVGSGRLIMKETSEQRLPLEEYFPEAFEREAEPQVSAEVSRLISRHHEKPTKHTITLAAVRAMTFHCAEKGISNAYAMVEKKLLDMLRYTGIEAEELEEPKYIHDLQGVLYPVKFEPFEILDSAKSEDRGSFILQAFFKGEEESLGQGFYPKTLVSEQK